MCIMYVCMLLLVVSTHLNRLLVPFIVSAIGFKIEFFLQLLFISLILYAIYTERDLGGTTKTSCVNIYDRQYFRKYPLEHFGHFHVSQQTALARFKIFIHITKTDVSFTKRQHENKRYNAIHMDI